MNITGVPGSVLSMAGRFVLAAIGSIGAPLSNAIFSVSLAPPAWVVGDISAAWTTLLAPAAWTVADAQVTGWTAALAPSGWQVLEAP